MERAVDILLYLATSSVPVGVAKVASDLALSKGTAHRYLTSFVDKGMVVQHEESEEYSLGPTVLLLSQAFLRQLDLRSYALPQMRRLHEMSGETVSLVVRDQAQRIYIDQIEGTNPLRFKAEIGRPYHLYYGSPGKAILANLPEHEISAILQSPNLQMPASTVLLDKNELRHELEQIRVQGYAASIGETISGLTGVSAAIKDHSGEVVGAIGISGLSSRFTTERIEDLGGTVREAAQRISKALGYPERKRIISLPDA